MCFYSECNDYDVVKHLSLMTETLNLFTESDSQGGVWGGRQQYSVLDWQAADLSLTQLSTQSPTQGLV